MKGNTRGGGRPKPDGAPRRASTRGVGNRQQERKTAEGLMQRALTLQEAWRWDEALGLYEQALGVCPEHLDCMYNLAVCLIEKAEALEEEGGSGGGLRGRALGLLERIPILDTSGRGEVAAMAHEELGHLLGQQATHEAGGLGVGLWQRACGHYGQAVAVRQRMGDSHAHTDPGLLLHWAEALLGTMGALAESGQGHEGGSAERAGLMVQLACEALERLDAALMYQAESDVPALLCKGRVVAQLWEWGLALTLQGPTQAQGPIIPAQAPRLEVGLSAVHTAMGLLQPTQAGTIMGEGEVGEWRREALDLAADLAQLKAQAARHAAPHTTGLLEEETGALDACRAACVHGGDRLRSGEESGVRDTSPLEARQAAADVLDWAAEAWVRLGDLLLDLTQLHNRPASQPSGLCACPLGLPPSEGEAMLHEAATAYQRAEHLLTRAAELRGSAAGHELAHPRYQAMCAAARLGQSEQCIQHHWPRYLATPLDKDETIDDRRRSVLADADLNTVLSLTLDVHSARQALRQTWK